MDSYIEITLLPDPEFPATVLMNAVYSKLHKALSDLRSTDIGVSFPKSKQTLGDILRIHGTIEALEKLNAMNWIGGMSGYCHKSNIKPVPNVASFRNISRRQPTMSAAKLRRLIKRRSITDEETHNYQLKMVTKEIDGPYVELISSSNGHKHRRYIMFSELLEEPRTGQFDQFGLSKVATIPWF